MGHASYYVAANHEAASKFIGQGNFSAKYSAGDLAEPLCFEAKQLALFRSETALWTSFGRSGSMAAERRMSHREKLMKRLVFAILLIASPAWAQTSLLPKSA